jgi:transposase
MGLCLLVYSLGQRALRQALEQAKQTISNQLGKPTATPTMRWVFQSFMSIHLVTIRLWRLRSAQSSALNTLVILLMNDDGF